MNEMSEMAAKESGIQKVIQKCRLKFRQPENLDYYSTSDYKTAERKFVKFCLSGKIDC